MAWTNIPDSALEPGKPIRAVDGLALRDNPTAIANGDPGAPRIQNPAYETSSIDWTKLEVGAATRFGSQAFSLTFGEFSGTNFASASINTPGNYVAVVMGQWTTAGNAGRWVRLYHGSTLLSEGDQGSPGQLWAVAPTVSGVNDFRLEFQRPAGGTVDMAGTFIVFAPIR